MLRPPKTFLFLSLLLLVVSSCASPSKRNLNEFILKDGTRIKCVEPPPDVVTKGIKVNAEVAAQKVGSLLKGTGGVDVDIERIRQEVPPDVSTFEIVEYRICIQYVNGLLSKGEYNAFTRQILPALKNKIPEQEAAQLVIEGVDDPLALIPQTNQPRPPKALKFAKIKVSNTGGVRISNIGVAVIKVNGSRDCRFQLAVSSWDTVFINPNPPVPKISVDLNPGDDAYFDAVIECNGNPCTKGELAIPFIENGQRHFVASVEHKVSRLEEFTVRVSGDMAKALTATFKVIKQGTEEYLFLQAT